MSKNFKVVGTLLETEVPAGGTRDETVGGFAVFNRCPHLLVEVPDGNSTISVRTSDGDLITFAFLRALQGDGAPTCVDIHHASGVKIPRDDDRPLHRQKVVVFGVGRAAHLDKEIKFPVTLTTVIMKD